MKNNNNMQSTPSSIPNAHELLQDLFYLATPTLEEERLCQIHKHEIPAILAGLKHQEKTGKYIVKKEIKTCTRCGEEKAIEEFAKAGQGKIRNICKICDAERQRNFYKNNKKREDKQMTESTETITKICTKCGKEKLLDEFNADKRGKYEHKSICKKCEKIQKDKYREKINACAPGPLKSNFDTDSFKRYLMSQIEFSKNVIQKMQGRIEAYQELISEL